MPRTRPVPLSATLATVAALLALWVSPEAAAVAPPEASDPHAGLPIGAPTPLLDRTPSTQLRLSDRPALHGLADRWGGRWAWRFDERTGRPHLAFLPGVDAGDAQALLDDLLRTLGPVDVIPTGTRRRGERWATTYQQVHEGLPVWGTEVALLGLSARIQAVRTALVQPPTDPAPPGAELWFPLALATAPGTAGKGLAPATRTIADDIVTIRQVDGTLLARWSLRHPTTVTHTYEPRTVGDTLVEGPMDEATADDGSGAVALDSAGVHTAGDPYDITLTSDSLEARDWRVGGAVPVVEGLEGDAVLAFGDDLDPAVADTWAHTRIVEDWLLDRNPDHAILDIQVVANLNIPRACNAFYTGGTINFFRRGGPCVNTGRIADVIYHEYGHGVHHYGLLAGTFAGDLSEGMADYISATILDDPRVGLGFFGGSSSLRDVSVDRVFPRDFRNQVHNDGRIYSSFLWNLREDWIDRDGAEVAVPRVDALMLDALAIGPVLSTIGDATILADDDDGDLTNGTPHACELAERLDQHGIGPGPIGVVVLSHDPPETAGSRDEGYPLTFRVEDAMPDCTGVDPSTVAVWWTTDPISDEDAEDRFTIDDPDPASDTDAPTGPEGETWTSEGGATWRRLPLDTEDGVIFEGRLPRQLATTTVHYFLEARSQDGTERITTHEGRAADVYRLQVGDREAVWCEDFEGFVDGDADAGVDRDWAGWESGPGTPWEEPAETWVDEWETGEPGEGLFLPDAPFEGDRIIGTNLSGAYRNLNVQYLRSPAIAVPEDGRMLRLSFRRWLTVEDSKYDKARIFVEDERVYQQPGTSAGRSHTLDARWRYIPLDAEPWRGEEVQLTWTLRSDPGLEYGGWALDQVCVERLADLPRHHRPEGLSAIEESPGTVALDWTSPWIAPLDELVVVRKRGTPPSHLRDGLWVHRRAAPAPGTAMEALDEGVEPCTPTFYAVFVQGEGVWYDTAVEGENLVRVDTACPEGPDPEGPDPVDPTPDGEVGAVPAWLMPEVSGCGCASGGVGGVLAGLLALPLVLLRRRRR